MRICTVFCVYFVALALVIMIAPPLFAEDTGVGVAAEVGRLMIFVEKSGCKFNRNGRWYDSTEAAKHIAKKYRYVKKRGMVKKTEDFIKYAATKSSMSGKPYTVQCAGGEVLLCSDWLIGELARFRSEH